MSETNLDGARYNDAGTHVATTAPHGELWWSPIAYVPTALEQGYELVIDEEVGYPVGRTPAALAEQGAAEPKTPDSTPPVPPAGPPVKTPTPTTTTQPGTATGKNA